MKTSLLIGVIMATLSVVNEANAHGGVIVEQGQCIMKIGPDTMTFTGYQPLKSREQFCDDIPDVGHTIIVLDAQQDELRDMTLELRILRNVGQANDNENLESNTEVYVSPKNYKAGTLNFEYNFANKGNFIGLVKARNESGTKEYVSRFPFAVGQTAGKNTTVAIFGAFMALVGFCLYYKHAFLSKSKAVIKDVKEYGRGEVR